MPSRRFRSPSLSAHDGVHDGVHGRLRAVFAEVFSNPPSAVSARIWAEVYGDECPAEVEPYSYVSRSELDIFVAELGVAPGRRWSMSGVVTAVLACGCARDPEAIWSAWTSPSLRTPRPATEQALSGSPVECRIDWATSSRCRSPMARPTPS